MAVGIIDYGAGNLYSIMGALEYLGAHYELVRESGKIFNFDQIILPGVGSFRRAMERLHEMRFSPALKDFAAQTSKPILGICLGMQLLCTSSDEDGLTSGLDIVKGHFSKFDEQYRKVPHIGFDGVQYESGFPLFKDIGQDMDYYFVHSYRLTETQENVRYAYSEHDGEKFISAFAKTNVFGTQFHPELSQINGIRLIKNFLSVSSHG